MFLATPFLQQLFQNCIQKCPSDGFLCNDNSTCIDRKFLCDLDNDCPNGDDEDELNCPMKFSTTDCAGGSDGIDCSRACEFDFCHHCGWPIKSVY